MKSQNKDTIQKAFTIQAAGFESKKMNFKKQEYLDYAIKKISPEKTDSVLEVAAGTCVCGRAIAPYAKQVVCLDMTPAMLSVGKNNAEKEKIDNIIFTIGDAAELPFLDNSFDIVLSRLAFHHFPNPKNCFSEMARVLKPGGKLVVIDMETAEEPFRETANKIEIMRDESHTKTLNRNEFLEMFMENHLSLETEDCTELPIELSAWLSLPKTPEKNAARITKLLRNELAGGAPTGFNPYIKNGEIYFNHRWLLLIAKKK